MTASELASELKGLRVLLVEDEFLVALLIEDALSNLECVVVAVERNLQDALARISSADFDIAILDVNLNGARIFPVAEELLERRIPFVFSTGYGSAGLPERWRSIPILTKPFQEDEVGVTLKAALGKA